MAKKKVGIYLEEGLADRLDTVAALFDGLKSEVVAAALVMFLEAETESQKSAMKQVLSEKVDRMFDDMPTSRKTKSTAELPESEARKLPTAHVGDRKGRVS